MKTRRNPFTGELEDYPPPQTFLCPQDSRPSRETVSEALGFRAPQAFVEFAEHINKEARGDPYRCVDLFGESLGIGAADGPTVYDSAPCELFPIGYPGVDGVHFGYLVHAPEIDADDYPICRFCPMDSDGVTIEGMDTYDGIASIMCFWGSATIYPNTPQWDSAVDCARDKERKPVPVKNAIQIPTDWRFESSSDGVGVLAPLSLFSSDGFITIDPYGPAEPFEQAAADAVQDGHLATALFYLREGYWHNWTEKPIGLARLLCDVYDKLNRQPLANVMRARIDKWAEDA